MTFDIMKTGYNRYQVDDTLNELNAELAVLRRQVSAYQKQSVEDTNQIKELEIKLAFIQEEIGIKERAASEMTQLALKEANEMIYNASKNADIIVREALLSAKEILIDMSKLGVEAKEMKEHMNDQLELLTKALQNFDVPPIPNKELLDTCDE